MSVTIYFIVLFSYFQEVEQVRVLKYNLIGKTAIGKNTDELKEPFVAVSRDLLNKYPLGSYIYLSGCHWEGLYLVADKMGKRHKKTIDVFTKDIFRKNDVCYCSAVR